MLCLDVRTESGILSLGLLSWALSLILFGNYSLSVFMLVLKKLQDGKNNNKDLNKVLNGTKKQPQKKIKMVTE